MTVVEVICNEEHRSELNFIKSKTISDFQLNYHSCIGCKDNPDFVEGFKVKN